MQDLTLYHYWRSSSSWRVRWALEAKGLKAKMVHVSLLDGESESEEHTKRNPLGFVPVLETGGKYLIESVAIIEWLEELVPTPALYPGDSYQRSHIRALVEIINADTQPLQNLTLLDFYSEDAEKRNAWAGHFIRRGLNAYSERCKTTAKSYSVGDSITAADIYLIPQLYNALRFGVELGEFPILEKIYQNAIKTPGYLASVPEKFQP